MLRKKRANEITVIVLTTTVIRDVDNNVKMATEMDQFQKLWVSLINSHEKFIIRFLLCVVIYVLGLLMDGNDGDTVLFAEEEGGL